MAARILDVLSQVLENYLRVQLVLAPLWAVHFFLGPKRLSLSRQVLLQHILVAVSVFLPLLMLVQPAVKYNYARSAAFPVTYLHQTAGVVDRAFNHPSCFSYFSFFSVVSLIGMLYLGFLLGRQFIHEQYLRRTSTKMRRFGRIALVFSDKVVTPFSTGLIRPSIYLPDRLRGTKSIRAVVSHEVLHARKRHSWFVLLEKLHTAIGWYNPLSHILVRKGLALREFLCDREATTTISPVSYGRVLLAEAEEAWANHRWALTTCLVGPSLLRRRIAMLVSDPRPSPGRAMRAVALLAAAASALLLPAFGRISEEVRIVPRSQNRQTDAQRAMQKLEAILDNDLAFMTAEIRRKSPMTVGDDPFRVVTAFEELQNSRLFRYNAEAEFHYLRDIKMKQIRKYRYSVLRRGWYRYHKKLVFDLTTGE